jgi:hypothetical protein
MFYRLNGWLQQPMRLSGAKPARSDYGYIPSRRARGLAAGEFRGNGQNGAKERVYPRDFRRGLATRLARSA